MLSLKEISDKYQKPHYNAKKQNTFTTKLYSSIATPIIWLLLPTGVSANQVTVLWVILGVVACCFFTVGKYWVTLLAVALFQIHIVLDYVDGAVARHRKSSGEQSKKGIYIERIGHDFIYTVYFYCISVGAVRKGFDPIIMLSLGFLASVGYFFYNYTRRAKILCSLVYDLSKNIKMEADIAKGELVKDKRRVAYNPLKVIYLILQRWVCNPVCFPAITAVAAIFDLVYILPVFYGIIYPLMFLVSYVYQSKTNDRWVYEWIKNAD